jgi:hypothetical protein
MAKTKKEIDKENYQRYKEEKKTKRRERYRLQKEKEVLNKQKETEQNKELQKEVYQEKNFEILLSLKEYLGLSKAHKFFFNFTNDLRNLTKCNCQLQLGSIHEITALINSAQRLVDDFNYSSLLREKLGKFD